MEVLTKIAAFLLSLFMTFIPYAGFGTLGLTTKEEAPALDVAMISDLHIEQGLFRPAFLKTALKRIELSSQKIDAIAVTGDITNYADEESLADYFEIINEYADIPVITAAGNHDIGHAGDRNVTDISREEARDNFVRYLNEYMGTELEQPYYSYVLDGYKFIVLGDEVIDGGCWDAVTMSQAQLDFLDSELASAGDKPVFVLSHWAIKGTTGEQIIWDGSGVDPDEYGVAEILEKYDNVFYISGHMHGGIRCTAVGEMFDMPMAEKVNGVVYMSLPSFGLVNQYGITWSGTGAQLEVYEDRVVFRPINYLTGVWYENSSYTFELAE